jgi:hypothetical protein
MLFVGERRRSRFLCVCQAAVWAVVESRVAGSGSDFSEELVVGVEPAAPDCRVAPCCPPGPVAPCSSFDHEPPNMVGQAAFQAGSCLLLRFTGRELGVVVGPSRTAGHSYLVHRDDVQREVELPVAAAREAMTEAIRPGHLDRRDAGVAGKVAAVGNRLIR